MDGRWLNTTELELEYGVRKRLAYTWFGKLQEQGRARRVPGGKNGFLLFNEEAARFLQGRRGKVGKARKEPDAEQIAFLQRAKLERYSIFSVAVWLGVSYKLAKRWLGESG